MRIKVFQSESGDALLIESTSGGPTRRILVDAGEPDAYERFLAPTMRDLRNETIDVVCVSHIDRDHIGGILALLDAEVEWRVHEHLDGAELPTTEPDSTRPPAVGEIWHNAFFEDADMNTPDIVSTLGGIGSVGLGHASAEFRADAAETVFIGQSVGDAIEVSRRIGQNQLQIPLNPAAGGDFLVLRDGLDIPDVGPLSVTILGPTPANLRGLINDWNEWLDEKADYLRRLLEGHEVDEDILATNGSAGPIRIVNAQAEDLATSGGSVTPPNVASLMLLIEEDGRRILLSGDGDDVDIISGLEAHGLLENGRIHVDVFKVPHHGATNSYTEALARTVIANNYLFCGNGKHENPERSVVRGYVETRRALAAENPDDASLRQRMKLWFNHSHHDAAEEEAEREAAGKNPDTERVDHWEHLEADVAGFENSPERPRVVSRFLRNARSMTFTLD